METFKEKEKKHDQELSQIRADIQARLVRERMRRQKYRRVFNKHNAPSDIDYYGEEEE